MNNIFTFIAITVLIVFSCRQADPNKEIDEGIVQSGTYTSSEIGWTIEIPNGWEVVSRDEQEAYQEKGRKAIEEVAGEFNTHGLKHLISFQKNQFNVFQSSSEPFPLKYEGEWEDNNSSLKGLLYDTYINQGIKVDTSSSEAIVDGINFAVFHIVIHGPKGEVILYQDMYASHINGFDFGAILNYNNDKDKEALMKVWNNSEFKRPKPQIEKGYK